MLVNLTRITNAADKITVFLNELSSIEMTENEWNFMGKILPDVMDHEEYQNLINFVNTVIKEIPTKSSDNIPGDVVKHTEENFPSVTPDQTGDDEDDNCIIDDDDIYEDEEDSNGYSHRNSARVPYTIKQFVKALANSGTKRKDIPGIVFEKYHRVISQATISNIINEKVSAPQSYMIDEADISKLIEDGGYVRDGYIYTKDGPLKHYLSPSLIKMVRYKDNTYPAKYLVAALTGMYMFPEGSIIHENMDVRDTRVENLKSSPNATGVKRIRKCTAEIERIAEVFAKHKGDALKTWVELFDDYGIFISHSMLSNIKLKKCHPVITDKYFTTADVKEWDNTVEYMRFLPLTPLEDESVEDEEVIEEELSEELEEYNEDSEDNEETAEMKFTDDEMWEHVSSLNKADKRNLSPEYERFVIEYVAKNFVKVKANGTFDMMKVSKTLKEYGFNFKMGLIKMTLYHLS